MTYEYKTQPFDHQRAEFNEHRHDQARALFWEMGCVDGFTEYLSPTGWVRIADYRGGPVVQWWPGTKQAEFVQPSAYIDKPCQEMIQIWGVRGARQCLSLDHTVPILCRRTHEFRRTVSAEELEHELTGNGFRTLPATFWMQREGSFPLTDAELRLQIAVMADGHYPSKHTTRCVLRLKKQRKKDRLQKLLAAAGIKDAYIRSCSVPGFTLYSFNSPWRLKHYDERFWDCSTAQLRTIIDEVFHWDGTHAGNRGRIFFSRHRSDCDFIQYAAASLGNRTSVWRGPREKDVWQTHVWKTVSQFAVREENLSRVKPVGGRQYCFTVPSGFLVLRREGVPFITGNCGKTKPVIDTFADCVERGTIDTMIIIAPNGVHANWIDQELPRHLPDRVSKHVLPVTFHATKSGTKKHQRACEWLVKHRGPTILAISYDSCWRPTGRGRKLIDRLLKERQVLLVVDESARIKTPRAKRTQAVISFARKADMVRILTGTPIVNSPFDIYSQIRALDPDAWKKRDLHPFSVFKSYFGIWITNYGAAGSFPQLVNYRNLNELHDIVAEYGSRLTKDEVLDLPPKLYSTVKFELAPAQQAAYNSLRDEFLTWLDSGEEVTAPLAMVRLLRLQQITCGYVTPDGATGPQAIIPPEDNPRVKLLSELLEDIPHKVIIWARFRLDIDNVMDAVRKLKRNAVCVDGRITGPARMAAVREFQDGDADVFVGNPAAAGEGITLTAARTTTYYSNSFNLGHRLQSEDRPHRIGQKHPVNYWDIVAANTVDERVAQALRKKVNIASIITGDKLKEWI